jgi:hypothetical protein
VSKTPAAASAAKAGGGSMWEEVEAEYELTEQQFEKMMMHQLRHYLFRKLNQGLQVLLVCC